MTPSLASLATPADRFDQAIRDAMAARAAARRKAAELNSTGRLTAAEAAETDARFAADARAAAGSYAAELIEQHCRTPYPPSRRQQGGVA